MITTVRKLLRCLREQADEAGDITQVIVISIALGDEPPCPTADDFEARFGGGGFTSADRALIMSLESAEAALEELTRE